MAITATTTAEEALAEYLTNLGYSAAGSTTQAEALIAAGSALLVLQPSRIRHGGQEIEFGNIASSIRAAIAAAQQWLERSSITGPRVFDMRGIRD